MATALRRHGRTKAKSRGPLRTTALVVLLLMVSVLGAMTPAAGTEGPPTPIPARPGVQPEAAADPSPLPSVAPSPAILPDTISADLFSQPPNPLTLTPVIDGERAVTKSIGPKGGTIKATGPDGTRFSLAIPRDDLLFETAITMAPVEDLTGFPTDATPAHHIGVQLEPDGLELAVPALLTIRPKRGFPTDGVVAMDYRHDGEEAGFHLAEQDVRQMTISVDHFSGYTAEFQLKVDEIRKLAEFNRRSPDDELSSQIAEWVALEKQRQIMGTTEGNETPDIDLVAGAKEFLPLYLEVVLSPKLAVAGRSCADAEAAMAAMISYQRNRQLLGVGQDPAFDIQGGTTVPQQLLDLHTRLCLREAYQECTRTGDFPDLMGYVYRLFTRSRVMLGVEPTQEQLDLAHGYLRRCGRYRLELKQADIEHGSPPQHVIASSDIELEWQPGSGEFGLVGSTIEGAADIEADLAYHDTACWETGYRILRLWTEQQARARIESLAFQRAEGPTQPGRSLPAQPTKLELEVKFGIVGGTFTCGGSHRWHLGEVGHVRIGGIRTEGEGFFWLAAVKGLGAQWDISTGHVMTAATIDKGWTFSGSPFKAEWGFHDPNLVVYDPEEPEDATVEVTLTHEPS